jgi:hypothetical protein
MAERKPAKKAARQSARTTTGKASKAFTDEESQVRDVRLQRQAAPRQGRHLADLVRAQEADRRRRESDRRAREESGELKD